MLGKYIKIEVFFEMKRVVIESKYLYNYYQPEKGITVGGTQRYSLDLGRLFYSMGYKVYFVSKSNAEFEVNYNNWGNHNFC